jgi:peptidoglycan/LPS O-acetylase OafA/YrhL
VSWYVSFVRRITSLDGLRAVSILLVIASHLLTRKFPLGNGGVAAAILGNATLGVNTFFVISGFLITSILLREHRKSGSIGLSKFYIRRAFRILPPYYAYLLTVALLLAFGVFTIPNQGRMLLSASVFAWDYWRSPSAWMLDHLWSIAIEEHFYLLWPAVLVLCLRHSESRARRVAASLIFAAPFLRVLTFALGNRYVSGNIYYMLHTRMDALMVGCLMALCLEHPWFEAAYIRASRYVALTPLYCLFVAPILQLRFGGAYAYTVGFSLENFCIALFILWAIRNALSVTGRILNSAPFRAIGVTSYSLYLWQTLFLHGRNHTVTGRFPLDMLCITAAAIASYYLVEKPSLRLRTAFVDGLDNRTEDLKTAASDG